MKSLRKLFLDLNTWIYKNMNKLYLWMMVFLTISSGIAMYEMNHSMSPMMVVFLNIFLFYGSYKIIFR
jgi:hypothetical protein